MPGFFLSRALRALAAKRLVASRRSMNRRSSQGLAAPLAIQVLERKDLMARRVWAVEDGGNGHEYEDAGLYPNSANFFEARAIADSKGGHLVTITSPAEALFAGRSGWVGAFGGPVVFEDEHWEWVTGEPMEYLPWRSKIEPNDHVGTGEYAVESWGPFQLNDNRPNWLQSFVIEYDGLRDQGLDDGPHATNDAESLATNLGVISGLTTVDASMRKVGDIDWYSFQVQATGDLRIRVPTNPYPQEDYFRQRPVLTTTNFHEFQFSVRAGRTYTFAYGNLRVAEELPYQMIIAPPGTSLPAASSFVPELPTDLTNLQGSVNDGESKYYTLTDLRRADIEASLTFDRSQGNLTLELVTPRGQVLATGVAVDGEVRLEHEYFHDRTLGGRDLNAKPWRIFLRVTASGGPVQYVLNASAQAINSNDRRLARKLGDFALGSEKVVAQQYPRSLEFQAPTTGILQVFASGKTTRIRVHDQNGAIVGDSMDEIPNQPQFRLGKARTVEFSAQEGRTYFLETSNQPQPGLSYLPVKTQLLILPGDAFLPESEPNNGVDTADQWGPRVQWVIQASTDLSGDDNSRTDVFEIIAGETGRLYTGAGGSNDPNSSMEVFVNNARPANEFVYKGDVIRYVVKHLAGPALYTVSGLIVPEQPDENDFEGLESSAQWGSRPGDWRYLSSAFERDIIEADTQPGVYTAIVETPTPEKYSLRVIDVRTERVVATGTPGLEELTASFVSYGGFYKMYVSGAGEMYSRELYRPDMQLKQQPVVLIQSPTGAEMGYFVSTGAVGEFTVNFVGEIEVSFTSASSGGAPFGAAHVGIVSSQGELVEQDITDSSAPIRMAVRPGKYFLGIETATRQSITAKVQFLRTPGDANGDGLVNIADFALLRANFNKAFGPYVNGDLNGDGIVDLKDFAILRANFNRKS